MKHVGFTETLERGRCKVWEDGGELYVAPVDAPLLPSGTPMALRPGTLAVNIGQYEKLEGAAL